MKKRGWFGNSLGHRKASLGISSKQPTYTKKTRGMSDEGYKDLHNREAYKYVEDNFDNAVNNMLKRPSDKEPKLPVSTFHEAGYGDFNVESKYVRSQSGNRYQKVEFIFYDSLDKKDKAYIEHYLEKKDIKVKKGDDPKHITVYVEAF
jgi:hypothetical protein